MAENTARNLDNLDEVMDENDLIKLLARIVREQNKEINNILLSQNEKAKRQAEEQRRLCTKIEKLDARLSSFLDSRSSARVDTTDNSASSLRNRVDGIGSAQNGHELTQDKALKSRVENLEMRINELQGKITTDTTTRSGPMNSGGLSYEDLQSLTEELAKRQLSMQLRIDQLTETVTRHISAMNEQKHANQQLAQSLRLSHKSSRSTSTVSSSLEGAGFHSNGSFHSAHCRTPSHSTSSRPPTSASHSTTSEFSTEDFHQQTTSLTQKLSQQDSRLSLQSKDLLSLKRRLGHAEKLIGARYQTGAFAIHGLSFYQDAAALRYVSDQASRDTFKMFYGNRVAAIDYADIAPSAILACFDVISRVRCCHGMWKDDQLEAKQQIRCAAEQIVDDWIKSLPLNDAGECVHISARELQKQFNQLKVLCRRADIRFDFAWPEI